MTTPKCDLIDTVRDACADTLRLPLAQVQPDAHLIDDLQVDSLFLVQLTIALEERFNIQIDEQEMSAVRTVRDLADHVAAKIAAV
jgi:acyl carrier protein